MSQINLGFIGFGHWPRDAYMPIVKELAGVNVVAVAARTEATRKFAIEQFGEHLAVYSNYNDLFSNETVDAVAIALPNELHAEAIEAALTARKHVFFEPPIGLTEADVHRVQNTMSNTDRVVQADLEFRYLPVMAVVRQKLASGAMGIPLMAKVKLKCNWGYGGPDWVKKAQDQGIFLWLGCWYLDVLDAIFARVPKRVNVVGGYAMNGRLMDHGWATMQYSDGGIGQFEFNLVSVEGTQTDLAEGVQVRLQVYGTKGEMEVDLLSGTCRWRERDKPWQEETAQCSQPIHGFVGMRESLTDFFRAIRNNQPVKADLQVCRRVHQVVLACTQEGSYQLTANS